MSDLARRDGARIAESVAASVLLRVPALTDALVRTIFERNPGYLQLDSVPTDDLWQSCHDNITRVLQMIADVDGAGERRIGVGDAEDYFDAAHATGRRRAEQRMPLEDVLRSFRLGGRLVWEALIEQAREQGIVDTDALSEIASRVWEVVDSTSSHVAVGYHHAERHLVRADEQRRAALWEGLLHGRAKDMEFAYEAARILGVPADGRYAVVVADLGSRGDDSENGGADGGEDSIAGRLGRRMAADRIGSAWQVRAQTLVGLLALGEATLDAALAGLRSVVPMPAGLSGLVSGLAEIDMGYWQAMLARQTLPAGRTEVVTLDQRLPEALLLRSPQLAEKLVRVWLGPMLTMPAADCRVLLDTLRAWVASTGSVRRTAELTHCHRNTVINRLDRIHRITGHDFTGGAFHVELSLALRAARLLSLIH